MFGYSNKSRNETAEAPVRWASTDKRHFIIIGIIVAVASVVLYFLLMGALPLPVAASSQAATVDSLFQVHSFKMQI